MGYSVLRSEDQTPMQRFAAIFGVLVLLIGCTAEAGNGDTDGPPCDISLVAIPAAVQPGGEATFRITITPHADWLLKTTTPFKARLAGGETITITKAEFSAKDFTDPKSPAKSISTTFKAKATGTIVADLSFFLCNDSICKRFGVEKQLAVNVDGVAN